MTKYIIQKRKYYKDYTESELSVPEITLDIWVLEDVGRPVGVKIDGETCIPEGTYQVSITHSTRFKKDMMLLSNQADGTVTKDGVSFAGVRPHGGNKTADTHGCPLCNFHTKHNGEQYGRASDAIFEKVKQWIADGEFVYWVITS